MNGFLLQEVLHYRRFSFIEIFPLSKVFHRKFSTIRIFPLYEVFPLSEFFHYSEFSITENFPLQRVFNQRKFSIIGNVFHYRKISTSKRFTVIENGNNRLSQSQVIMPCGIEQSNFLLQRILNDRNFPIIGGFIYRDFSIIEGFPLQRVFTIRLFP